LEENNQESFTSFRISGATAESSQELFLHDNAQRDEINVPKIEGSEWSVENGQEMVSHEMAPIQEVDLPKAAGATGSSVTQFSRGSEGSEEISQQVVAHEKARKQDSDASKAEGAPSSPLTQFSHGSELSAESSQEAHKQKIDLSKADGVTGSIAQSSPGAERSVECSQESVPHERVRMRSSSSQYSQGASFALTSWVLAPIDVASLSVDLMPIGAVVDSDVLAKDTNGSCTSQSLTAQVLAAKDEQEQDRPRRSALRVPKQRSSVKKRTVSFDVPKADSIESLSEGSGSETYSPMSNSEVANLNAEFSYIHSQPTEAESSALMSTQPESLLDEARASPSESSGSEVFDPLSQEEIANLNAEFADARRQIARRCLGND
jgi:hypothetical protein